MESGAIVVVKYGGSVMEGGELAEAWARDIVALARTGARPLVVHGGGPALTRTMARMGIESRFVNGHRVTTGETAEIAEMVLSGRINKEIVSRLNRAGARAVGLSGTDGGMLEIRPHRPGGEDIGFVGEIEAVDTGPLRLLLDNGYTPVLSSTAADGSGQPYNINADLVAGAVAAALGAAAVVFLSDVPGVIVNGEKVGSLTVPEVRALLVGPKVTGGMRPKLEGALAALEAGVPVVHLADGRVPAVLLTALFAAEGMGTRIVAGTGSPRLPHVDASPAPAIPPAIPSWSGTLEARGGKVVMGTYARYPIEIVSGNGCRVVDSAGRSYLDFVGGIAVNVLGHGHPAVVTALCQASRGILHTSNLYWSEPMVRLAERLTHAAGMEVAFFCNSGAEAIETALKVARKARPRRPKIIVFERSFHGRTLGALSVTIQSAYQDPFRPLLPGIVAIPFGDFDGAARAIDEDTVCVLVEPIQGEGGVRPASPAWLRHLREACDRTGALLVLDEVQTGLGRSGRLFAFEEAGITPDAVACAKALAGGLPMGALLARGDAARALGPGDHGCTFGGGPFVATVANAVLDVVLDAGFLEQVAASGERLGCALRAMAERHPEIVAEARGRGLMWGLALRGTHAPDLVKELHGLGLLTVPAGKDVLRLLPPLVVSEPEIDEAAVLIDAALTRIAARPGRPSIEVRNSARTPAGHTAPAVEWRPASKPSAAKA